MNNWLRISHLVYPPRCILCGAAGDQRDLCTACAADLPLNTDPCPICSIPLRLPGLPACGSCLLSPPPFQKTVAPLLYRYPVDALVRRFKFDGRLAVGRVLAELLADAVSEQPRPDFIVPVPLHRKRLIERGFDQAAELARIVGRRLGVPVRRRVCRRICPTVSQSTLSRTERRVNLRRAFACRGELEGRSIAVVDDVMTTGTTVTELANTLLRAGAETVDIWVCVRAVDTRRL